MRYFYFNPPVSVKRCVLHRRISIHAISTHLIRNLINKFLYLIDKNAPIQPPNQAGVSEHFSFEHPREYFFPVWQYSTSNEFTPVCAAQNRITGILRMGDNYVSDI